jgi:hypothetical protein
MESFEDRVPTFTSDKPGNYDQGINQFILDPFFGVPFSSRNILKFRLEYSVVAWSWQLMVFEPSIPNPWNFVAEEIDSSETKKARDPTRCQPPIKPERELQ